MITSEEEYLLIDRILAGDRNLYATLVDKYKSYAYTIAMKVLENRPEAEEAAQDAFIKAFHYLKGFNRQAKFSTWLYRIVSSIYSRYGGAFFEVKVNTPFIFVFVPAPCPSYLI